MATRLVEIADVAESAETAVPASNAHAERVLSAVLMMTLKTLSQKTLQSLAAMADLLLIGSAFALWYRAMAEPTTLQLAGLGGYSIFILCALWARRRV